MIVFPTKRYRAAGGQVRRRGPRTLAGKGTAAPPLGRTAIARPHKTPNYINALVPCQMSEKGSRREEPDAGRGLFTSAGAEPVAL